MMLSKNDPSRSASWVAIALATAVLAGAATNACAQYKIVGPDGRVTYTDKPPATTDARIGGAGATPAANAGGALPYEVRQAMSRYPVALYAAKSCAPCDQARQWLKGRGIPFSEYSIETDTDATALKAKFGDTQLPVTTLGSQVVKGFSASDLQSYADAAGYPKSAHLAGYSWPAPTPLAPPTAKAAPAAQPPAPAPAPAAPPPPPPRSGIQF